MKHKIVLIAINSLLALVFVSILNEMVIVYQETIVNMIWSSIVLYTFVSVIAVVIVLGFAIMVLTLINVILQDTKKKQ